MNFSRNASQARRQAQRLTSPTLRLPERDWVRRGLVSQTEAQIDESSYEASPDYQNSVESYLKRADVKAAVRAARLAPPVESADSEGAEQSGLPPAQAPITKDPGH